MSLTNENFQWYIYFDDGNDQIKSSEFAFVYRSVCMYVKDQGFLPEWW